MIKPFTPNKWASSIAAQKWAYQQKLIDQSGDWAERAALGDITTSASAAVASGRTALQFARDCGLGVATAAFAGYVAGRVGVKPTLVGIGISYGLIKAITMGVKK